MNPAQRNRRSRPTAAAEVLSALTGRMGLQERLAQQRIWLVWDEVVGEQTARHARPVRLREGQLEVRVDHPVWMQQLQLLKPQILQRLNATLPPAAAISDIHWRQGQPPAAPILPPSPATTPVDRPLTLAEQQHLDRLLPPDDDELHAEWRRLLQRHLLTHP